MREPLLLRVEKALELLPDLEALAPLRALVLSIGRADEQMLWASAGPYLTVGKRGVDPAELRRRMPEVLERVAEHIGFLFRAYADALDAQQRSEPAAVVAALVAAGQREEAEGRQVQARAWYEAARPFAAALQTRRPENECLQRLGSVCIDLGQYDEAARYFQRSLALAEAEFDQRAAIASALGLGDAALARGEWAGANAWYSRALRLGEAVGDAASIGGAERQLGILAHRRGDLTAAGEHLRRARERFEALGDATELGRVLNAQGQAEAALGRQTAALAAFREALAWSHRAPNDAALEIAIRLNVAELALETGRLLAAEEDLRRAEEAAIAGNLPGQLVGIYTLMGKLRSLQNDETGFVFFEQAIELCRTLGRPPGEQARVYREYGSFRGRLGQGAEARAYLEHARQLFEAMGRTIEVARVTEEIEQLTA